MLALNPTVQSPRAYDLANLGAAALGARLAAGAAATLRTNLRTAQQDAGYRFLIHPAETALGLVAADITYGYEVGDVRRYGCTSTSVAAVNNVAVQRAFDVCGQTDGTVLVYDRLYPLSVSITVPNGADVQGHGWNTGFEFTGCHGLTLSFTRAYGNTRIKDIYLSGVTDSALVSYRGVNVPGTTQSTDEMYGLTLNSVLITGFDTAVYLRTVRNWTIIDSWFENTNVGLDIRGKNLVGRFIGSTCVCAASPGPSATIGVWMNYVNYADVGDVAPEGIVLTASVVYGYAVGVQASACNLFSSTNVDLAATVIGYDIVETSDGCTITGGIAVMYGTACTHGVYVRGKASSSTARIDITGLYVTGSGTTACVGVQVNSAGNTHATRVNWRGGGFTGMTVYDILVYNARGHNNFEGITCASSGVTEAIKVQDRSSGITTVRACECTGGIEVTASDARAGYTRVIDCTDDAGNLIHTEAIGFHEAGNWTPADASGAGLVLAVAAGTYTLHGGYLVARGNVTYPATVNGNGAALSGLPHTGAAGAENAQGSVSYSDATFGFYANGGGAGGTVFFYTLAGAQVTNAQLSGKIVRFEVRYKL